MARIVEVVPHSPQWANEVHIETPRLKAALGENVLAVHHAGSTAIPGIKAKPILDFLVEVADIELVDGRNAQMADLGYQPRGEYGLPGRRYFVKFAGEQHSHHVHVYQRGHPDIGRTLLFRDYLIAHPTEAQEYSRLKESLAQQFPTDSGLYTEGKTEFVRAIEEKAALWAALGRQ